MRFRITTVVTTAIAAVVVMGISGCASLSDHSNGPLVIEKQGSFAAGGSVQSTPGTYANNQPSAAGQSFHGDHLYAFYQVPQHAKALPIVMLHGAYPSARSWETT